MKTTYIYLARLMSACVFYLFLAKANTWLDTLNNTVLVFGYRSFILFAPLFLLFAKRWMTIIAFFMTVLGVICWSEHLNLMGTILFAAGMAVGGYVLKYQASKTHAGAANNRIAMNVGGMLSGLLIAVPSSNNHFLLLGFIMLMITFICVLFLQEKKSDIVDTDLKNNFTFNQLKTLRGLSWALIGMTVGIKMVSITTVLPQYLLHYYDHLPHWYGWAISLNCIVVILLQKPIMRIMQNLNMNHALIALQVSMVTIALPGLFLCQNIFGTIIWAFLLTILECAVSYLDIFARKEGSLLIKEFSVGIGMALGVLVMRSVSPLYGALFIGCFGLAIIFMALKLFTNREFIETQSINPVTTR